MNLEIIRHTPFWVWAMLAKLVAIGLWQTRARQIGRARVTLLPLLMIGLSLGGVLGSFGVLAVAVGGWATGVGAALAFGRHALAVPGAWWSQRTGLRHVPGSWLPLALMLALFALKYCAGASLALHPALGTDAVFAAACSFGFGGFSGLFLARSLSLRMLATQRPGRHAAGAAGAFLSRG